MKHYLNLLFYSFAFFVLLLCFSGCQFPERENLFDDHDDNEYEENYAPADGSNYRSGNGRRRRRSGGGGSSSSYNDSLSVSVCDRDTAVQSAIICQLFQNGTLSVLDNQGQQKGCEDINSDLLSNYCGNIDQSDLNTIQELRIDEDLEISYEDFADFINLKYLFLVNVDLEYIPMGVFSDLSSLILLDLSDNDIGSLISDMFLGLSSLAELSFSGNRLSNLPAGVFSNLSGLEVLNLSDNEITSPLNDFYSELTLLEELDLSDNDGINQIDKDNIESAFSGNPGIDIIFD